MLLPYVISSRVRLARNLQGYRFPPVACGDERKAVLECVQMAAAKMRWFNTVECVRIDSLSPLERSVLAEKHLISSLFVQQERHRLVIIAKTADFSILVNEEDHLRIQAIRPGMQLRKAWQTTTQIESSFREQLDFAYSQPDGYLTTCSSNTGTGMRVSVMLFLPGLILLKQITPILQKVTAWGYTVRGMYGEGSKSQGYLLQLSRRIPYQENESDMLHNLEHICESIVEAERRARGHLRAFAGKDLRAYLDQVCHSLETAKQVMLNPGMQMLAALRLGIALKLEQCRVGAINDTSKPRSRNLKKVDELFRRIQPAHVLQYGLREQQVSHLHKTSWVEQPHEQEDVMRAKVIRQELRIKK